MIPTIIPHCALGEKAVAASGSVVQERLLTSVEVAAIFRVEVKTLQRWAASGRITSIRTPGGRHRRYRESDVLALIAEGEAEAEATAGPEAVEVPA